MVEALNNFEVAIQDYNDFLDNVLCVHFEDGELMGQFFCPIKQDWTPNPDYTWKANEAII